MTYNLENIGRSRIKLFLDSSDINNGEVIGILKIIPDIKIVLVKDYLPPLKFSKRPFIELENGLRYFGKENILNYLVDRLCLVRKL